MNKILLIVLILISNFSFASNPQLSDLLIINKDTIQINKLPLEEFLERHQPNYIDRVRRGSDGEITIVSPNCFRGYQAIWKLENEKLYLVDIVNYGFKKFKNPKKVLKKIFKNKFKEGQVFADWFSSELISPKGKIINRLSHSRIVYEKIEKFKFSNGELIEREIIENDLFGNELIEPKPKKI